MFGTGGCGTIALAPRASMRSLQRRNRVDRSAKRSRPSSFAGSNRSAAILLSAACHQRATPCGIFARWRCCLPAGRDPPNGGGARLPLRGAGQELPGGIVAVHTPGPEPAHYGFWREEASPAVVFSADLIMREDDDAEFDTAGVPR